MNRLFLFVFFISCTIYQWSCKPAQVITNAAPVPDPNAPYSITKNNTTLWLKNQDSKERQTLVRIDSLGNIHTLAAQFPVLDLSNELGLDSGMQTKGSMDVNQLLKMQTEQAKLYHKSSGLLITNEALYRLSEAYFNGMIDTSQYRQLYDKTISQLSYMIDAEIELEEAKAETVVAETEKAKIELQKLQLQLELLKIQKGLYIPKEEKADSSAVQGE